MCRLPTACIAMVFAGAAGCSDQACYYEPTSVAIVPGTTSGGDASAWIYLSAFASGRSCGCCGDKPPTAIVSYGWDTNGDGKIDLRGAMLTGVELPRPTAPLRVSVTVTDNEGTTATATILLGG
jgi:hypothetical protein